MSDDITGVIDDIGETMQHIIHRKPTTPAPGGFFENVGGIPLTAEGDIVHLMRSTVRPLADNEWARIAAWSGTFQLRNYPEATRILSDILDADDQVAKMARISAVGNFLVERLHGRGDSEGVGRMLFDVIGPSIQHWGADIGCEMPEEEILAFLSGPASYPPPVGQGIKNDRWVIITVGCALALFRQDLREDADAVLAKIAATLEQE